MSADLIPPALINAVQEQRAVLFLGAGTSVGAKHPTHKEVPLGDRLRDEIADRFLGGLLKNKPLTAVAAMAASEAGLTHVQSYVRELFLPYQPSDTHLLIPTFRWRAIATTNFDLIIERAYEHSRGKVQNLVKSVKDGDQFDTRQNATSDPVGFYKLHGCIDSYADAEAPMILGTEQYTSYASNRLRFYGRLKDLAYENPIVFCGYSISDAHIQQLLFDLTDKSVKRPMYYNVSPGLTDIEGRYWAGHQVTCLNMTFSDLLKGLDQKIAPHARSIRRDTASKLSVHSHYARNRITESDDLKFYLERDALHIHGGMINPRQDAQEFYKGYDTGFGCIASNLDIKRSLTDSVLVDALLADDSARKWGEVFLLKGPAGNGKTVALKRIAWEAANFDRLCLYVREAAGLRIEPLKELHVHTGKRIFLFIDRVALIRDDVLIFLRNARSSRLPVTIIAAERENEWNIYCEALESFVVQEFNVAYLSREEIVELLEKLEMHRALGFLQDRKQDERIDAFLHRADKQLLVALHETTLGVPFEKIVLDEYNRVRPLEAQRLYLEVCALHQFGVPVRAGLISRASGFSFEEFGRRFLKPLAEVVLVDEEKHSGDLYYRSRHQHVAELVFNQVASTGEDKYDLLSGLLAVINTDYSSDRETFSRIIRGRDVARMFASVDIGRLLYDRAQEASKNDAYVLHQRAVFELQHPEGALSAAEISANNAAGLNPRSRSIRHTQAEIARRQANDTKDVLRKQVYRRTARERLAGHSGPMSEYDLYTRARVSIDEVRELLSKASESLDLSVSSALVASIKEAETTLQRGRLEFPGSSELLVAETEFRDLLDQTPKALGALEKAFQLNPRQDWLAIRLSRRYADDDQGDRAFKVLERCLIENPASKSAHLEMAQLLRRADEPQSRVLDHLRKSFVLGDTNFEGQFWYARELFLSNRVPESKDLFQNLNERAPGRFRRGTSALVDLSDGQIKAFDGVLIRREEGYGFVRLVDFADDVFTSRAESDSLSWEQLRTGSLVVCNLAFNRRGPRAVRLTLRNA